MDGALEGRLKLLLAMQDKHARNDADQQEYRGQHRDHCTDNGLCGQSVYTKTQIGQIAHGQNNKRRCESDNYEYP